MSGPWWKPGRDWEQEEATFPAILTSVPRWHSMVVDLGNGDRSETFTTTTKIEHGSHRNTILLIPHQVNGDWKWATRASSSPVGDFVRSWGWVSQSLIITTAPQQYYKGSTMIELSQITMNSQSARSEAKMENALQPIRCFLSWRIPLTTCWGWAWIQEWIEKDKKTTSIMKLEIHFVIELVGLAIL